MNAKRLRIAAVLAAAIAIWAAFPAQTAYLIRMLSIAWAVAWALEPLCGALSKKLSRGASAWAALGIFAAGLVLICVMLLPPIISQLGDIVNMVPGMMEKANGMLARINEKLASMGLNGIEAQTAGVADWTLGAVTGAFQSAGTIAQSATAFSLGAILGVFLLTDIDRARYTALMLIPVKYRALGRRMARDVSLGLRMYVKGQLTVSVIVGAISAGALWLTGVKSPVALGAIIGVFNIIPYFGPIFGGVPAVATALSQSLVTALFCVAALFAVQQVDSVLISPRVMSSATGLRPSSTIIAMAIGGAGWGPIGMLLALPAAIIIKIAGRTWASRND